MTRKDLGKAAPTGLVIAELRVAGGEAGISPGAALRHAPERVTIAELRLSEILQNAVRTEIVAACLLLIADEGRQ